MTLGYKRESFEDMDAMFVELERNCCLLEQAILSRAEIRAELNKANERIDRLFKMRDGLVADREEIGMKLLFAEAKIRELRNLVRERTEERDNWKEQARSLEKWRPQR